MFQTQTVEPTDLDDLSRYINLYLQVKAASSDDDDADLKAALKAKLMDLLK